MVVKVGSPRANTGSVVILPADPTAGVFGAGTRLLEALECLPLLKIAAALTRVGVVSVEGALEGGVSTGAARGGFDSMPWPAEGPLEFNEAPVELSPS